MYNNSRYDLIIIIIIIQRNKTFQNMLLQENNQLKQVPKSAKKKTQKNKKPSLCEFVFSGAKTSDPLPDSTTADNQDIKKNVISILDNNLDEVGDR